MCVCGGGLRGLGGVVQGRAWGFCEHLANLYRPELCAGLHARPTTGSPVSTRTHQNSVSSCSVSSVSSCLPFCSEVRLT